MVAVVGVHGIAQQLKGASSLAAVWFPALQDGLTLAGASLAADDFRIAFYGNLFRRTGSMSTGWPAFTVADLADPDERALLTLLWHEASVVDDAVPGPEADTMVRTPRVVQRALSALSRSQYFAGVAERVLIAVVKQVHLYFTDDDVREAAIAAVEEAVTPDTRVVVGHSLGSVVAYEALARHPEWGVHTFVSLGSPLGIAHVVLDRLRPAPVASRGCWPGSVAAWTNVASPGDVVALEKRLGDRFDARVTDVLVDNQSRAHDVAPYLTAVETGRAVASGLR